MPNIQPIGMAKLKAASKIESAPIYNPSDVEDSSLRTALPGGKIGAFRLVDKINSKVRLNTAKGVKGLDLNGHLAVLYDYNSSTVDYFGVYTLNINPLDQFKVEYFVGIDGKEWTRIYAPPVPGIDYWPGPSATVPGHKTLTFAYFNYSDYYNEILITTSIRDFQVEGTAQIQLFIDNVLEPESNVIFTHKGSSYLQLTSPTEGEGVTFPIIGLEPGKSYTISVDVEILNNVDDVLSMRIRNYTRGDNQFLIEDGTSNNFVKTSTAEKNTIQTLSGTFHTKFWYTLGDRIEVEIVQKKATGENDPAIRSDQPFEFKVYNNFNIITGK